MYSSRKAHKRTEHVLKDIINDKDNANKCGECGATFPTWASVNLGIFLCGRCASVHRNLGEDITIVKSLTLDKWTEQDLDNLSNIGNRRAKKFWNPKKEPFPYDDDDKDEISKFIRNKYVLGKFRYEPPTKDDYNLNGLNRSNRRDRFSSSSPSLGKRNSSGRVPTLSHKDIPEIERLKYRKLEPVLQDKGFNNMDDNYEALSLSKGDISLAIEILSKSPDAQNDSNEVKPPLPRRPGVTQDSSSASVPASVVPATSSSDWWSSNNTTTSTTGLIEPPQQYLDPSTGIIYVDPVQQQLYEQQQAQLLQQQQTNVVIGALPQFQQAQFQQPQQTGLDKSQLLSLYNTGAQQQQQQPIQQQQTFQQQPVQAQYTSMNGYQTGQFPQSTSVSPFPQQQQQFPFGAQQQQQQPNLYGQQQGQFQQYQFQ